MEQSDKADTDVRRAMQMESLKHDLSKARSLREIVLGEIKNGVRPEWIAVKYGHLGATLERVLAAKAAIDKQQEAIREREVAKSGDSPSPEVGQVNYGT